MANYKIITDSGCDLPSQLLQQLDLQRVCLTVNIDNQVLEDSVDEGIQMIYEKLRSGVMASTSAINPDGWTRAIEPVLQEGKDVLVLTFSSGLSTTYQSAVIAAGELAEAYPQRKICVVDSLAASLGQGLLLWHMCRKRDEGMSLEELVTWTEENKFRLAMWFTVDDLGFLKRGGRVSAATALVGTMLQIKPVLHVDNEGHLISMAKARGRKASLDALLKKFEQTAIAGENDTISICHGDCLEDAEYVAERLKKEFGVKNVIIGYTGAVIGSHSGPGTMALFFLASER